MKTQKFTQIAPPNLPLLDATLDLFPELDFHNTMIIAVQHLLPTTHSLFHALFAKGLSPSNLYVLGKCYSTNTRVFQSLVQEGANVSALSLQFDSHVPYDFLFESLIAQFLDAALDQDLSIYQNLIILDDGGHLLQEIHQRQFYIPNLFGIEQTSAGYNRTKHLTFDFPIINLARSWVKLKYETPLILNTAMLFLKGFLDRLERKENILIFGNGVIGNALHQALTPAFEITLYDQDPLKSLIPFSALPKTIKNSKILIGCTGMTSLPKELHENISTSTLLASFSSSDREFDAVHLRKKIARTENCHSHLEIEGIRLLNCGFPINFDEEGQSADNLSFELTRSLIFASLAQVQSRQSLKKGFQNLSGPIQKQILKKMKRGSHEHKYAIHT